MKEKIIFAPGINGSELMKSLALHGVKCFNQRVCGAGELARMALMRSGISVTESFLSSSEESEIIAASLEEDGYFGTPSYSDIQEISGAIRRMRHLVGNADESGAIEEALNKGPFRKKNDALLGIYKNYMKGLSSRGAIDPVGLIRRAVAECKPMDAEFVILKEFPLDPLERALLDKISGGNVTESRLMELFGVSDKPVRIENIKNCHGAPNEVETILADVYDGKQLDKCTVAITDIASYGQLFFDYALLYDIPTTFGCGIPIINSNPARLLVLYYHWITDRFFSGKALQEMLSSQAFNRIKLHEELSGTEEDFRLRRFYQILENLRMTNNRENNETRLVDFEKAATEEDMQYMPYLKRLAQELALPIEDFISKYSYIRKGSDSNADKLLMMLDMSAVRVICEEAKTLMLSGSEQDMDEVILHILGINVCRQNREGGKMHITGISGAMACVRENLYIAGLSAVKFPGSPKENYLLLDEDLKQFSDWAAEHISADGRIQRKREMLLSLVELASGLGAGICISYAGLNVSELKKENASSLIFELFRRAQGDEATSEDLEDRIIKVKYFEPAISVSRLVGDAYIEGKRIIGTDAAGHKAVRSVSHGLDQEYSPTALETFFGCPRRFMLRQILGIPEPSDENLFDVIPSIDSGNLAHDLMEELGDSSMSREAFLKLSEKRFDRFILERTPLIGESVDRAREEFLEMMGIAYDMDPHREVVLHEEDIHCTHETGVKIHGFPDRVEKLEDGTYLIVDFKSGSRIKHEKDDIDTCLQVVIYAYLMEAQGKKISGCEYRYIRLGETVTCKYDDEMKGLLSEKLDKFQGDLQIGHFPLAEVKKIDDEPCRYCKFSGICGINVRESAEEGMVM